MSGLLASACYRLWKWEDGTIRKVAVVRAYAWQAQELTARSPRLVILGPGEWQRLTPAGIRAAKRAGAKL